MKKTIKYILLAFVAMSAVACEKWTEVEKEFPSDLVSNVYGEDYYANLRAYRESDHPIIMGYWQGWGGASASLRNSLMGLPDSVDMVSMWGSGFYYNEDKMADLKEAQEKKGIKCLLVFIAHSIGTQITPSWVTSASEENPVTIKDRYTGEPITCTDWVQARRVYWGMDPNDGPRNTAEMNERAVRAAELYADSLCYLINDVLHLDGFDWDFEYGYSVGDNVGDLIGDHSNYCSAAQAHDRTLAFCKRMREGLGDKIFMIDGVPQYLKAPEACIYFDYFAQQAYTRLVSGNGGSLSDTEANMDTRTRNMVNAFRPYLSVEFICNRTIMLESFEGASNSWKWEGNNMYGGAAWTFRDGTTTNANVDGIGTFEGMALWNPVIDGVQYRKGGIGAYLLNNDYEARLNDAVTYPQTRNAIQLMNPAVK